MVISERTDLACENLGNVEHLPKGAEYRTQRIGSITVSRLTVTEQGAAEILERAKGCYVSYQCRRLNLLSESEEDSLICLLSEELTAMARRLTGKAIDSSLSVYVVGLGNREMTADALGAQTVDGLTATRHLKKEQEELYRALGCCSLSSLAPGVLGQTGIESLEILRGTVTAVSPDLVVAVDALAARGCDRLASTVQITDTGICPGSGVGNHRSELSAKTLGIPVISVGIPTVVHSSTLILDALCEAGISGVSEELQHVLKNRRSFFVTPRDCDAVTSAGARILAGAIMNTFSGDLGGTFRSHKKSSCGIQ